MAHVKFIEQTLRDGQQSLWGLRMRAHQAGPALADIDATGFHVVDLTGAGIFQVLVRQYRDNPWDHLDFLINGLPKSRKRSSIRTITAIGFGFTPDSILDLFVQTLAKHGTDTFWMFDCLFDIPVMKRMASVVVDAGAKVSPTIMYGLTDVHTDEFFAGVAKELASWEGVETIEIEDAPGVLTPERAATLLPALRAAAPDVPFELHCHNTTGLAPLVYIEGLKHGIEIIHTVAESMANGPSLPSTVKMLEDLRVLGHTHSLDESRLEPVSEHFRRAAKDAGGEAAGFYLGVPYEFSLLPYRHQLPGGMTGTLRNQLAQHGMADRLEDVLEETILVREDLGQPIMATPFSQFVGIQAVLNIVTGERYKLVPDEVIQYTLGHYGPLMRPVAPDVADRILSQPRAEHFRTWERPQPSLKSIRAQFGKNISDEELLLRYMVSEEEANDVFSGRAAKTGARSIVAAVKDLIDERRSFTSVSVSTPELSVRLKRSTDPTN
jgi:oxaloacetate decarboxylase (Na+ extruding) subunit alpha